MKWYKHLTGSLHNSFIFELIQNFGGDGYLVFFGALELMADEFDLHNPGYSCFPIKKLTQNFQLSRQKTVKILAFCNQKAKENPRKNVAFFVEIYSDHVSIFCNRLAELCDTHTQKLLRETSKSLRSKYEITSSQEEEEEEEYKNKVDYIPPLPPLLDKQTPKKPAQKKLTPPTKDEVVLFVTEKGFPAELGRHVHDYYENGSPPWTDANGKPVRAWKQKITAVWLKPENKNFGGNGRASPGLPNRTAQNAEACRKFLEKAEREW